MRKRAYSLLAGAAILLLVGAGCGANQQAEVDTGIEVRTDADAKMQAPGGSIDASVDAIIEGEQTDEEKVEGEADEVDADKTELDAYSESTYEIK